MSKALAAAALCSLAVAYPMLESSARASELPAGNGRETLKKICTTCHDLDSIPHLRYTRDEWRNLVNSMKDMGAEASAVEFAEIIRYLVQNFGREEAPSKRMTSIVPRLVPWEQNRLKKGQALYRANCSVCHDVDKAESGKLGPSFYHLFQRKTMPKSNLKTDRSYIAVRIKVGGAIMPAFGKRLTGAEVEMLIDYMASK